MKKKLIVLVIVVAVAAVVGLTVVKPRLMSQTSEGPLKLFGNVDIREVSLGFRVAGRLETLHVEEGDLVKAGQVLASLDDEPLQLQLTQAEAGVAAATAKLKELKNGFRVEEIQQARANVGVAQSKLELAELDYKRQQQLDENQVGTQQLLDASRSNYQVALASLEAAQARLQLLEAGVRAETIEQATAEVEAKKIQVAQLKLAVTDCELKAPSNGTIRSRIQESGAILPAGAPVFVLALDEQPWVRAYVSEANLGKIQPGMKLKVFSDSRPDQAYSGHVGFISPTAEFTPKSVQTEKLRTDLVYRFRIIIEDADSMLRQGMPVTIQL